MSKHRWCAEWRMIKVFEPAMIENPYPVRYTGRVIGFQHDDVLLAVMPFFHVGGRGYYLYAAYTRGCTTVILPDFDRRAVLGMPDPKWMEKVVAAVVLRPGIPTTPPAR